MKTVLQVAAVFYYLSLSVMHLHAVVGEVGDEQVLAAIMQSRNHSMPQSYNSHRVRREEGEEDGLHQDQWKSLKGHEETSGNNASQTNPLYLEEPPHASTRNRSGKFLFDMLFGIESEVSNAFGSLGGDDSDYDENASLKLCDCDCGYPNEEIRIIGGKPTGINQYPWMARIVYQGKFQCGGSLVTQHYVLTAAHCVRRLQRSQIRVIFGDHDQQITTETKAIQRVVTSIIKHRNFNPDTFNNDIALLKLRKPITFSRIIKPVCLPRFNYDPAGHVGTVVGWGRTIENGVLASTVNQVKVPIMSIAECRNQKYKTSRITTTMLCAGQPNRDSCQGDSGGPLLLSNGVKYFIVGIVSWGVGCGREGYPGVYTRVSKFIPWIKSNLKNTCLCT